MMKKSITILILILTGIVLIACHQNEDSKSEENTKQSPHQNNLVFQLNFDENESNTVKDTISNEIVTVSYVFTEALYKENESLRWISDSAVRGSALAFDGYSNKIQFNNEVISVSGSKITIDVFIAPRMFEWSWPGNTSQLQVIVGQFNKSENMGFVLGMHKYGNYSFQVGLGDQWVELWNEWNPLERYKWNHITAVYDGNEGFMKLYKNGEIVNEKYNVYGSIEPTHTNLLIGAHSNPERLGIFELNMFNGLMDELKIFNIAYTKDDVVENHEIYKKNNKINEVTDKDGWLDDEILNDDYYRPIFHATPPQHWMNEPHSLFFYNGYYHLFYQFNLTGPYWRQIVWGHWVSKDMIDWQHVKEAFVLNPNNPIKDGAWSGGVAFDDEGTPVLFITAGDDSKEHSPSNQNLVIATPKDLNDPFLTEWDVASTITLAQTNEMGIYNEFRDFTVYKEDDTWYMLATGSKTNGQGTAHIFTTKDDSFKQWDYHGNFFEPTIYPEFLGSSWELVNLAKVTNKEKTIEKYIFVFSPAGYRSDNDIYYYIGHLDKKNYRFIAEHELPLKMDFGENVFTGPGLYMDKDKRRVLITSITQDQRSGKDHFDSGWAHSAGMPKELWLDDSGNLIVLPIEELTSYMGKSYIEHKNSSLESLNQTLKTIDFQSQTLYIKASLTNVNSNIFGIQFKKDKFNHYSSIYYDDQNAKIMLDTRESGNNNVSRLIGDSFILENETLDLIIVIDHAVVEIYINDSITMTASIYNTGTGFEIIADGTIIINNLSIYEMIGGK